MLFHSFLFLAFLPVVLAGHAALRGRALRWWMVGASYMFYGWGSPAFCLLLVFSTALDYTAAQRIDASDDPRVRRAWLALSALGNLGILGLFKYSGMALRWLGAAWGFAFDQPLPGGAWLSLWSDVGRLDLPVGISFYTFQTLSYTIDVYRGRMKAERDFSVVALYVAFFPQLVAGPIERATHLMPQLAQKQPRTRDDLIVGATRVLWGMMKKLVFADWFGHYVSIVWGSPGDATPWALMLALHAFSFQVYLDFSAYSDMAIGLARMMGIRLRENFRWPFLSRNPIEFWTRWHISLTTWVRDYLYIPLGGNRVGPWRAQFNSLAVMLAIGLWHGADEKFLVWGFAHWIYEVLWRAKTAAFGTRWYRGKPYEWRDAPAVVLTYCLVIPQVFFGAPSLTHAWAILERMLTQPWGAPSWTQPDLLVGLVSVLLLVAMAAHVVRGLGLDRPLYVLRERPAAVGALWAGLIAAIALLHAPSKDVFYYFQF